MNFRNISAWSIRNPVPSLVLFTFLTLAGIISFMQMDVQNDPDIDFPVVLIQIAQPGAAPTELETQASMRSIRTSRKAFRSPSSSLPSARPSTAR